MHAIYSPCQNEADNLTYVTLVCTVKDCGKFSPYINFLGEVLHTGSKGYQENGNFIVYASVEICNPNSTCMVNRNDCENSTISIKIGLTDRTMIERPCLYSFECIPNHENSAKKKEYFTLNDCGEIRSNECWKARSRTTDLESTPSIIKPSPTVQVNPSSIEITTSYPSELNSCICSEFNLSSEPKCKKILQIICKCTQLCMEIVEEFSYASIIYIFHITSRMHKTIHYSITK